MLKTGELEGNTFGVSGSIWDISIIRVRHNDWKLEKAQKFKESCRVDVQVEVQGQSDYLDPQHITHWHSFKFVINNQNRKILKLINWNYSKFTYLPTVEPGKALFTRRNISPSNASNTSISSDLSGSSEALIATAPRMTDWTDMSSVWRSLRMRRSPRSLSTEDLGCNTGR